MKAPWNFRALDEESKILLAEALFFLHLRIHYPTVSTLIVFCNLLEFSEYSCAVRLHPGLDHDVPR